MVSKEANHLTKPSSKTCSRLSKHLKFDTERLLSERNERAGEKESSALSSRPMQAMHFRRSALCPAADGGVPPQPFIPPSIKAIIPPVTEHCACLQHEKESCSDDSVTCQLPTCGGQFECLSDSVTKLAGRTAPTAPVPVHWLCRTCGSIHSVLEILTERVSCDCGEPSLQAVYNQFGDLFLFWRDDPDVQDLRDPAKLREAAWRLRKAGGLLWFPPV